MCPPPPATGVSAKHPAFKATSATALGNTDDVRKAYGYAYEGTGPGGKRMLIVASFDGVKVTVVKPGPDAVYCRLVKVEAKK